MSRLSWLIGRIARVSLLGAVAILLSTSGAEAQETIPGPSFEDVIGIRSIGGFAISPDGRRIAYEVRSTNWEENRYETELWLWREGGESFRLTRTPGGTSRAPQWSSDGRWLAFLSDRGVKQQIQLIRPDGGEAFPLTEVAQGVNAFRWAPSGTRIAFVAPDPEDPSEEQRSERYGAFAEEDADPGRSHLWMVDVVPDSLPEPSRLTEGRAYTVSGFEWSPDGTRIAFAHQPTPSINARGDISVIAVETRTIVPVVTTPGSEGGFEWSPDGRWLLYTSSGADTTSDYYRNDFLFKVPVDGGEPVRLAADLDETISGFWWRPNGIYLIAADRTERRIYLVDPGSGKETRVGATPERVNTLDFSSDGRTMALTGQTPTSLTELYRTEMARYRPERLTRFTDQIGGWTVGTSEVVRWTSQDGVEIEGVLHKPADFDPGRRYPLLVVIHGGPTGIDYPTPLPVYVYPIPQWLAKGAVVLRPNYRGSAGYGERFRSLNVRNLGVGDAWDVLSGVDYLVAQGFVDTTRMGAMGWSQGGYISAFLTTTTDRFKAISVGAGISNWMTYYVNTDIHPFTRQYLQATPWDDPEIYAKTSPMTYIRQARTPTLIQHGEFDRRVPIPNAYELYQGLQDVGVPTKLIVYKGFGHGITKPKERLAATWHNWQWFAKYLWGEDVEPPVATEGETP